MIKTDFLPRICDPDVIKDVFTNGRKAFEVGVPPTQLPTMPIEFSVAAYRLGHSMVRKAYNWNVNFDNGERHARPPVLLLGDERRASAAATRCRSSGSPTSGGSTTSARPAAKTSSCPAAKFNRAMRIDTSLVNPLAQLPQETIGPPKVPKSDPRHDLAFRNLTRAKMVNLATGQQMVAFMKSKGVKVKALTAAQIRQGDGGVSLAGLTQTERDAIVARTPLWFYILREAELNGGRLAGVGARIVAETFHRAMEGSATSIVRDPTFKPDLGPNASTFRMVDLLLFAFEGKKKLLNPNGG